MYSPLLTKLTGACLTAAIVISIALVPGCDATDRRGSRAPDHTNGSASPSSRPVAQVDDRQSYLMDASVTTATLDLGYMALGERREFLVRFRNRGSSPLGVLQATSGCSCLRPRLTDTGQNDGISQEIGVVFTAPGNAGVYEKTLAVRLEATSVICTVKVHARVGLPLSAVPVDPTLIGDSRAASQVTVTNDGPVPVRLLYALSGDTRLRASVPVEAIPPGGKAALKMEAVQLEDRPLKTVLTVRTDAEHQRELRIPVRSEVAAIASVGR